MASTVISLKMAAAPMSTRLAISACLWPKSCTPSRRPVAVAGEAHGDAMAAGVVGLVVVGFGADGERVEAAAAGLVVPQPGAGHGVVEDLDDLGAEAAGERSVAAEGVLPCHPALFVGGGAEGEVGVPSRR